ncbi:MAG: hypothetical protein BWY76_00001 [bacterium ADurb.Bin429]|nr:MAG: hypothetical protein BWY76_00001 [bacterium ADurb.Bin429]
MEMVPWLWMPITSPAYASSTISRSEAMKLSALASFISLPLRTCSAFMPPVKVPEQMRMKATRSRCMGSMLAWILNTKPLRGFSSALTMRVVVAWDLGAGACSTKKSSSSWTPKLLTAEPKKTGVSLPAR